MSEEEKEEYEEAISNGKYIAHIYGEGSIGWYKVYSMIDLINKLQKENKKLKLKIKKYEKGE